MYFKQFKNGVYSKAVGSAVKERIHCYNHAIVETVDGVILVDGSETLFSSLEDAKQHIKEQLVQEDIQKKIQQELYEEMSYNKIADIIKEHHGDIKVTDTLIESYVELASSKIFTLDPVAYNIARFNKLDKIVEGRLDYKLDDGSSVIITEETYQRINNTFANHPDVIGYMRTSAENFLSVVNALEE